MISMIISQPPVELTTRASPISSEVILELPCIDEEDDVHICGTCKRQFNDIFLFMRHKSDGSCTSIPRKKLVSVAVPPNATAECSPGFSSVATSDVKLFGSSAETAYTRVAILSSDKSNISKLSPPKGDTPPPLPETLHFAVSSLSEASNLILSGVDEKLLDLRKCQSQESSSSVSQLIKFGNLESQQRRELLQQHGIQVSEHFIEDQDISDPEDHTQPMDSPGRRLSGPLHSVDGSHTILIPHDTTDHVKDSELQPDESQNPGQTIIRRCGFLDVEDVEVATLLANHLANEPTLHMYPSASESLLSYSNIPSQLGLADSTDGLNFVSDIDMEDKHQELSSDRRTHIDLIFSKKPGSTPSKGTPVDNITTRKQSKGALKKPKVHLCQVEGCGFQGLCVRDLNRHMRKHTGEKPFKCPQCNKYFSRGDKVVRHLRIHTGTKSHKCEICGYASSDHYGLVRHMRVHNDERPYKCQICNYGARTMSHLKVHLRTHTGVNPYVCKVNCGKAFKTSSDLQRHMKMHSGDKPFPCPHCSYRCALKSNLQIHIRLTHSTDESFACSKCDVVCRSRRELKQHEKTHGDNLQCCTQCDYTCVTKTALKTHSKIHSTGKKKTNGSANSKGPGSRRVLTRKRLSPKKAKESILKSNEESHEFHPKTFNCEYCNAGFWREDALEIHRRQHDAPIPSPAPQDPVLADSADSRDSTGSNSMDNAAGLTSLATLASYHSMADQTSSDQQPAFLYRYISGSQSNDNIRNPEILTLHSGGGGLPQYVAIQGDVDTLNSMQYVLPSPLGSLDDSDNATPLLC